jgi:uroporphyrinogen decarboxylase
MVEGQGSKTFSEVKRLVYGNPGTAHLMLEKIADAVTDYLNVQIEAGADAVQLFDTWGGILTPEDYRAFSLNYMERIVSRLNRKDTPVIVFSKGVHTSYEALAGCGADVVGLDWNVNIGDIRAQIGDRVALQGNMDPTVLYAGPERIKEEAEKILRSFGAGNGHVFNLGHGILPDVPPENLKVLVEYVQTESGKYHLE